MFVFQNETDKYYGFHFCGKGFDRKLCQTYLPVDQLELDHLLHDAIGYTKMVGFKILFGLVKELTLFNGEVRINSPSKVGGEKFQAFILKRKGEEITNEGSDYFINGVKLDMSFQEYNVTILEVDE